MKNLPASQISLISPADFQFKAGPARRSATSYALLRRTWCLSQLAAQGFSASPELVSALGKNAQV